jgi:hypothetical protein
VANYNYRITTAVGNVDTASGVGAAGDANSYAAARTANTENAANPATVNLPIIANYNAVNSQKLPAAGIREYTTGAVTVQGANGYYWSSVPSTDTNGHYLSFNTATVLPVAAYYYSRGYSVRCLRR